MLSEKEIEFIEYAEHWINTDKYFFLYKQLEYSSIPSGRITDFFMVDCEIDLLKFTKGIIYKEMFYKSKQKEVHIPEGITDIREYAFAFSKLEKVTFPQTLETIGTHAFSFCTNLTQVIIPEYVKVHPKAFIGITGLDIVRE